MDDCHWCVISPCAVLCCVVLCVQGLAQHCHAETKASSLLPLPLPGDTQVSGAMAWLISAHSLASHSQPPDVTPRKNNLVHALESPNTQADFSAVLCSWFYKSLLPLTACSVTVLAPASALLRLSIFLSCHGYVSHLICDLLSWVRLIVELCASRPLVTQLKLA